MTAAFASLHTGFAGCLGGVAGAVAAHRWCSGRLDWRVHCAGRAPARTLFVCQQRGTGLARIEHLDQRVMLSSRDRQFPRVLDGDPVDGVLAPVRPVVGFPVLGSPSTLRTVGAGRYGNQVLRIIQVVGVLLPFGWLTIARLRCRARCPVAPCGQRRVCRDQ